jgi:hypothetical protein
MIQVWLGKPGQKLPAIEVYGFDERGDVWLGLAAAVPNQRFKRGDITPVMRLLVKNDFRLGNIEVGGKTSIAQGGQGHAQIGQGHLLGLVGPEDAGQLFALVVTVVENQVTNEGTVF